MPMQRHLWLGALWLAAAHVFAQPLRPKEDATAEIAQQAIAAYRKWGFEVTATSLREIGSGFVMDDYLMAIKL